MTKHAIVVSVSGGKDSTALLLHTRENYPHDEIFPVFADTGNEHPITLEYLDYLATEIMPIYHVKPELDFLQLAVKKKRFPSAKARFCTELLKMRPVCNYIQLLDERGYSVENHIGIRHDESAARANALSREWSSFYNCDIVRPLVDWTVDNVWEIHRQYGIKANPLYAVGATRVGCMPCIHARKSEIKLIAEKWPEVINKVREWEKIVTESSPKSILLPFFFIKLNLRPYCPACRQYLTDANIKVPCLECGGKLHMAGGGRGIDEIVKWAQTDRGGKQYPLFNEQTKIPDVCGVYNLCE